MKRRPVSSLHALKPFSTAEEAKRQGAVAMRAQRQDVPNTPPMVDVILSNEEGYRGCLMPDTVADITRMQRRAAAEHLIIWETVREADLLAKYRG